MSKCQQYSRYCNAQRHNSATECHAIMQSYYRARGSQEAYCCNHCPSVTSGSYSQFLEVHGGHCGQFTMSMTKKMVNGSAPRSSANQRNGSITSSSTNQNEKQRQEDREAFLVRKKEQIERELDNIRQRNSMNQKAAQAKVRREAEEVRLQMRRAAENATFEAIDKRIASLMPLLSERDFISVIQGNRLTDNVIDASFMIIVNKLFLNMNIHIFNTTFSHQLFQSTDGIVGKGWTRKVDIFNFNYLVIPCLHNGHYFLMIVTCPWMIVCPTSNSYYHHNIELFRKLNNCSPKSMIFLFNSIHDDHDSEKVDLLLKFIQNEWDIKKRTLFGHRSINNTSFPRIIPNMVKQTNDVDCGMYIIKYLHYYFSNISHTFNKEVLLELFQKCDAPSPKSRENLTKVLSNYMRK